MYSQNLIYEIALTSVKGVGDKTAKNLLAFCGGAKEIFTEKKSNFLKIPGIGEKTAEQLYQSLHEKLLFTEAEKEIKWLEKEKINAIFFSDSCYPQRLKHCSDSPIMLYKKGTADLNPSKMLSIVGTRTPSEYGISQVINLIQELSSLNITIVSGLAYGIDILVHQTCLENNLPTIAVLAHGLQTLYPQSHKSTARKMMEDGALLTEFRNTEKPDKENFPRRNRIVAGLCDAVIVIETRRKGGSLITAEIANSYNKDVFAFPGRAGDEITEGCNYLIKSNKAALIENAQDLLAAMCWREELKNSEKRKKSNQQNKLILVENYSDEEKKIILVLQEKSPMHLDELSHKINSTISKTLATLLQLEFSNIVCSIPGKLYRLNN